MKRLLRLLVVPLVCATAGVVSAQAAEVTQKQLDPVPGPQLWVEEHWHIKPESFDRFMEIYKTRIYPVLRTTKGYRGYSVVTSIPPKGGIPDIKFGGESLALGPPDNLFPAHPGINLGETRTDRMVHLGSLLKDNFNIIIVHHIDSWENFEGWVADFQQKWREMNNGEDMWDSLQDEYFTEIVINHWDTVYRVVETSFVRD